MFGSLLQQELGGTLHAIASESWVLHVPSFRPSGDGGAFAREWDLHPAERRELKIFGRRCFENRYSLQFLREYRYAGQTCAGAPLAPGSVASELLSAVNEAVFGGGGGGGGGGGVRFDSCLANWYEPEHWIAAHRDDERCLVAGAPVASVSWGASRRFVLRPRAAAAAAAARPAALELVLADGDLVSKRRRRLCNWTTAEPRFILLRSSWAARARRRTRTRSRSGGRKTRPRPAGGSRGRSAATGTTTAPRSGGGGVNLDGERRGGRGGTRAGRAPARRRPTMAS